LYSSNLACTSALDGVDGQSHAPAALPPGKRSCTHFTRGWVGPRTDLYWRRKSLLQRESIPGPPSRYTDRDIPAQFWSKREIQVLVSRVELEVYSFFILPLFFNCLLVSLFFPSFLSVFLSFFFLRMNANGCLDGYSPYFAVIHPEMYGNTDVMM